ncbi:MAG: 3',5'-cyclic adenosine monophosphate phosphodiesterase CpdA [Chlamydiia bacterium]|nr:3',5'-cyclic adenosine monophosphate phosphodiesterase CpdA [Chlamydiia bacterium]MCH9619015.1 3',5'-cyclic adenosine monophosphate phosphodiesterase CpdA [Chlamydiia bacterium]MCH9624038.1 3',5'-cyclic adenosine monophosphate phosphodiesterase CpdA [Chlamydiia bacterium]
MKIAHISDIHFFSKNFSLEDLFNKKWIGKLNAYVRRKNFFITDYLDDLLKSLLKEGVDTLLISGDFTTTSDQKEFASAYAFVQKVLDKGIKVLAIPGNHDVYTKKSFDEKLFSRLLDNLSKQKKLGSWDLLLLDNTMYNSPLMANGRFTKNDALNLQAFLKKSKDVVIINHFPLDDPHKNHELINGDLLKDILLNHKGTVIYLHGHTHKTAYHQEGKNLHIFNSSEVTVKNKFKYHLIELGNGTFRHKEVKYHGEK